MIKIYSFLAQSDDYIELIGQFSAVSHNIFRLVIIEYVKNASW